MKNHAISNTDNIIDVRAIIARVEELETERDAFDGDLEGWSEAFPDDASDLGKFTALLDDLKGYGGDEQWRGDWYPVTLIRDSHFQAYAEELAEDCGMIKRDATWPNNCIDWEEAARQLQQDYATAEYDGVTYWYR